jgi:protein gp37
MKLEWAQSIRDQCQVADVAFFFKQWGGRTPKVGGRLLDGLIWDEMPQAWKLYRKQWGEYSLVSSRQSRKAPKVLVEK